MNVNIENVKSGIDINVESGLTVLNTLLLTEEKKEEPIAETTVDVETKEEPVIPDNKTSVETEEKEETKIEMPSFDPGFLNQMPEVPVAPIEPNINIPPDVPSFDGNFSVNTPIDNPVNNFDTTFNNNFANNEHPSDTNVFPFSSSPIISNYENNGFGTNQNDDNKLRIDDFMEEATGLYDKLVKEPFNSYREITKKFVTWAQGVVNYGLTRDRIYEFDSLLEEYNKIVGDTNINQ